MSMPSIEDVREALIAKPGKALDLSERPTHGRALIEDKDTAADSLKKDAKAIDKLKDRLFANADRALLLVLQGMDTAGKSGTIRGVFSETTPLGMDITAFKAPTKNELARDYLWRIHGAIPKKGHIGVFDRSHYEDVLVVKVRKFASEKAIEQRYEQINEFERHLTENGITIVKCMLNVGFEQQGVRLRERLNEEHKLWKFNPGDLDDRKLWPDFMKAYETDLTKCSTKHAPWYVVPCDSRTRRNALIARLVRGALEDMDLGWPQPGHKESDFDFSDDLKI